MNKLLRSSALALALTIHARPCCFWEGSAVLPKETADPFTPRPRSKGEKARNRKNRNKG